MANPALGSGATGLKNGQSVTSGSLIVDAQHLGGGFMVSIGAVSAGCIDILSEDAGLVYTRTERVDVRKRGLESGSALSAFMDGGRGDLDPFV